MPLWHLSLDDFLNAYRERPAEAFFPVMHGYLRSLRALADEGVDIVTEAVITPERSELYRETFDGITRLLVGVRCPPAVGLSDSAAPDRRGRGSSRSSTRRLRPHPRARKAKRSGAVASG